MASSIRVLILGDETIQAGLPKVFNHCVIFKQLQVFKLHRKLIINYDLIIFRYEWRSCWEKGQDSFYVPR